ncbi:MAG: sulfur carrier protein ThiS [Verrucomicrobia bacterium]|nr:sulfur carrier protein ThiS [Verrucomicrobiota bacterium]
MKLMLNGKVRDTEMGATLTDLLTSLQLPEKGVLIELNGRAVPRTDFSTTILGEADTVEIVRMVGGG